MVTKQFVMTDKSMFTLSVPFYFQQKFKVVAASYKFKFTQPVSKSNFMFANLMVDGRKPKYIGMVFKDSGKLVLTPKSESQDNSWEALLLKRVLVNVWADTLDKVESQGFKVNSVLSPAKKAQIPPNWGAPVVTQDDIRRNGGYDEGWEHDWEEEAF